MPRYHFHVFDGRDHHDDQGEELPDLAAARVEAVRFAGELLNSGAAQFWEGEEWTMRVTDASDLTLFTLAFMVTNSAAVQTKRVTASG